MNLIFLLDSTYPCYTGGRETWLYNVCQRLCTEHRVFVLSETPYPSAEKEKGRVPEIDSRIQILHSPNLKNCAFLKPFLRSYLVPLNREIAMCSMERTLRRLLRSLSGETCYVISMDTVYTGRIALKAKKTFPNTVFINSVRGPHADILSDSRPLLSKFFHRCEQNTLAGADQIWSNGWDTQETLKAQGFSSIVIKNGIDTSRAARAERIPENLIPANTSLHILTIGTLLDIKGYPELIRAAGILKRDHGLLVSITAFGKGDPSAYLRLAEQEGVAEQVCFAGHQSKTVEYAAGFDLVAALSNGGGLSMACLESLLSGTPVIAWDSPIYRQMVTHGKTGWLVKENDAAALAAGILWIAEHREKAAEMGQAGQEAVRCFDWNQIVRDMEHALEELSR